MKDPDGYTVIARKWRPGDFGDIVGQDHVVTTLKNALNDGRIAHAYLFCGPRGVGKTTTARVLAKALNCEEGPTADPCGRCQACLGIAQGSFMDVLEIDGASNRGIDEVRELREGVRFSPAQGRYKVVVIDEVHMLTQPAFNALLKTLEEPPRHVVFILATTDPGQILPTIVSRCQRFDFHRVSITEIVGRLRKISEADGLKVQDPALLRIASLAEGSLRDAEGLLDQLVVYAGANEGTLEDVEAITCRVSRERLRALLDSIAQERPREILLQIDDLIRAGTDPVALLGALLKHVRELLFVQLGEETAELIQLDPEALSSLREESHSFSLGDLMTLLAALADMESRMRRTAVPRVLLELCLLKACQWIPGVTVKELLHRVRRLPESPTDLSGQVVAGEVERSPGEEGPSENVNSGREDLEKKKVGEGSETGEEELNPRTERAEHERTDQAEAFDCAEFLDRVKNRKPMLAISLQRAQCRWDSAKNVLSVGTDNDLLREQLQRKENTELLEDALHDMIGSQARIGVEPSAVSPDQGEMEDGLGVEEDKESPDALDSSNESAVSTKADGIADGVSEALEHDFVKQAIETFNARLLKVDKPQPFDTLEE